MGTERGTSRDSVGGALGEHDGAACVMALKRERYPLARLDTEERLFGRITDGLLRADECSQAFGASTLGFACGSTQPTHGSAPSSRRQSIVLGVRRRTARSRIVVGWVEPQAKPNIEELLTAALRKRTTRALILWALVPTLQVDALRQKHAATQGQVRLTHRACVRLDSDRCRPATGSSRCSCSLPAS